MPRKVILTKRHDGVHACLEGNPGIWASGETQNEAVGDLVRFRPEKFELVIEWDIEDSLTRRYLAGDRLIRDK